MPLSSSEAVLTQQNYKEPSTYFNVTHTAAEAACFHEHGALWLLQVLNNALLLWLFT